MSRPKLKEEIEIEEKEAYISRELGAIIVDYDTTKYYETNDTGTFIIKMLHESKTEEEIVKAISEEYEIDIETIKQDLTIFLEQLKNCGLLE